MRIETPPSEKQWGLLTNLMQKAGLTPLDLAVLIDVLIEEGKINPEYVQSWEQLSGRDVSALISFIQKETS